MGERGREGDRGGESVVLLVMQWRFRGGVCGSWAKGRLGAFFVGVGEGVGGK